MKRKKKKGYKKGGKVYAYPGGGTLSGQNIGATAGTAAALAIPGAQPFAPVLSKAGSMVGSLFDKEPEPEAPATAGRPLIPVSGMQDGGPVGQLLWQIPGTGTQFNRTMATMGVPREFPRRTSDYPAREPRRVKGGAKSRRVKGTVGASRTSDREARPARRYQEGGGLQSMNINGRHHEAGGESLEAFGRPDVEVERGEAILFDESGRPLYVFSAMDMEDKPNRSYAEEFNRLKEKGDEEGINKLQIKQEKAMGRTNDVTMDNTIRKATFAKTGGSLRYRGGGSTNRSSRYVNRLPEWRLQTGGTTNPWDPTNDDLQTATAPSIGYAAPPGVATVSEAPVNRPAAVSPDDAVRVESGGDQGPSPGREFSGRRALDVAGQVAPYAADLFNIATAASMKEPDAPAPYSPTLMDPRVSTTGEEEAITRSARAVIADPTATSAQKLAAVSGTHAARNQVRSRANQRADTVRARNVQSMNQAQQFNRQAQMQHQRDLAQFRGARASAISQGVRAGTDRLAARRLEEEQMDLQPMQLASLVHSLPTDRRRAFVEDLLNSLPPDHRMREQLEALKGG